MLRELEMWRDVGATCAVLEAIVCDFDEDLADFFCISPIAGDAINAAAAKQLPRTNPLFFIIYLLLPFFYQSPKALAPDVSGFVSLRDAISL